MDPQTQASFIPKKPLVASAARPRSRSFGFVWVVTLIIFIGSLASAGGAFAYVSYLQNTVASQQNSLALAQASYDPSVIADIIRLDSRITQARTLLKNHVSPSAIFTLLENDTLSSVRFSAFEYSLNPDGTATLTLSGEALDFPSVALQADAFGQNKSLKDVLFTNINIDPTTGHIVFKVTAHVDAALILYSNNLSVQSGSAVAPPVSPVVGTSSASSSASSTAP